MFKTNGYGQVVRLLQNTSVEVQQLKKFAGDVEPIDVMSVRFRRDVGDNRPARLHQLTIQLRRDFVRQQAPKNQIGRP